MVEVEGKWEMIGEVEKTTLVVGVPRLNVIYSPWEDLLRTKHYHGEKLGHRDKLLPILWETLVVWGLGWCYGAKENWFMNQGNLPPCIKGYHQTFEKRIT